MSMCSCAVRVTIFSTGGKFQRVSNFMELQSHPFLCSLDVGHYSFAEEGGVLMWMIANAICITVMHTAMHA